MEVSNALQKTPDAAGMGVDIGDIEVVMQWKIAKHTTLATLWQQIGRPGHNINTPAISVVWIESRHLLPATIPTESVWVEFDSAVSADTFQSSTQFMQNIYKGTKLPNESVGSAVTAYHRIDPSVLRYINTKGCRARCLLAAFCDGGAYSDEPRQLPCCDNCYYSQRSAMVPGAVVPGYQAASAWMKASTRFFDTEDSRAERTLEQMQLDQHDNERKAVKTSLVQQSLVSCALDEFALATFGSLHRLLFPAQLRRRISLVGACCISKSSLAEEANHAAFNLENSALSTHIDAILLSITQALANVANDPNPNNDNEPAHEDQREHAPPYDPISQQMSSIDQLNMEISGDAMFGSSSIVTEPERSQELGIGIPESVMTANPEFRPAISVTNYNRVRNELLNNPDFQFTNSIPGSQTEKT